MNTYTIDTTARFTVSGEPRDVYHMVDTSGNHFVNSKCVNPLDVPQSVMNLRYEEVRDEFGKVVSYRSIGERPNVEQIGSTIPIYKYRRPSLVVTGHIKLRKVKGRGGRPTYISENL